MKLTKREAFLLKLVGVIALLALAYYFVIAPQLEKFAETGIDLTAKILEVESVKGEIQSLPQLDDEINTYNEEIIKSSEAFYPELQQKKLIVILDEQLRESGASADSMGFSQLNTVDNSAAEASGDADAQVDEQSSDTGEGTAAGSLKPDIHSMSIQVPFNGSYEQIMNFIKRLESLNRMLIISSIQMTQDTDGQISGAANLDFYSIGKPTLDSRDEEYMNWPYNTPHGVDNPFRFIPIDEPTAEVETAEGAPE